MKFLVDAQLPKRLATWLRVADHDATHTLDLPKGNRTSDIEVSALADRENRIVITKDDDFIYSFLVRGRPERLLLVSTGNIGNADLLALFQERMPALVESFSNYRFVELTRETILVHE